LASDLAVGIVACLQTHGSRANWHPHLHLLVTDGGFRPDGTFVSWPAPKTAEGQALSPRRQDWSFASTVPGHCIDAATRRSANATRCLCTPMRFLSTAAEYARVR